MVAAIGVFVIPAKRKKGKEEMRQKIAEVRQRLSDALRTQFRKEIDRAGERIRASIAPYSRFVRAEGEKLEAIEQELVGVTSGLASLRSRIHSASLRATGSVIAFCATSATTSLPFRDASITCLTRPISAAEVELVDATAKGPDAGRAIGLKWALAAKIPPRRPTLA